MNIAFSINNSYFDKLTTTIVSILKNNAYKNINFYIFSSDFQKENKIVLDKLKLFYRNANFCIINVDANIFNKLKLNIDHISIETYYRYIIADLLEDVDKILYLDADIIVNGSIANLWDIDLANNYIAGCSDLFVERVKYKEKIDFNSDDLYINAGVLLMNLKQMRQDNLSKSLIDKTIELWDKIKYQDQDIINIVCKNRIKEIDCIYNFAGSNSKRQKHLRKYAIIIHYTGTKKPWHKNCKNKMRKIWSYYNKIADKIMNKKIKVGLIIDEFFGGAGTAFGGYGFLARKYIAKYIPNENIEIDVLLGKGKDLFTPTRYHEDNVDLYTLPRSKFFLKRWLKKQNYDIYLSIELTYRHILECEPDPNKKLILWIQDPRPKSAWEDVINTMQSIKDVSFYKQKNYDAVHNWNKKDRVKFISQGYSLNPLAFELYNLPKQTPVQYLPNPIDLDFNFQFDINKKKKQIIFLGRLEAQKRPWLFCLLAKKMPEYEFYIIGKFFRYQDDNKRMLLPYIKDFQTMQSTLPNLHFMGHLDGDEKIQLIKESRILLSTAIWEGIPISWLEALSFGTLIVSNLERENLVENYGLKVNDVLGDGFDKVDNFIPAIKEMMENDEFYAEKAKSAVDYIRNTHNINKFIEHMRDIIYKEVK